MHAYKQVVSVIDNQNPKINFNTTKNQCHILTSDYRIARNIGREYNLEDWLFYEHIAKFKTAKCFSTNVTPSCVVSHHHVWIR